MFVIWEFSLQGGVVRERGREGGRGRERGQAVEIEHDIVNIIKN